MTIEPIAPDQIFDILFRDVQSSGLFEDSKTFADAIPLHKPAEILNSYSQEKDLPSFYLKAFIEKHFTLEEDLPALAESEVQDIYTHIDQLWSHLERRPDEEGQEGSLIPLKFPYIVPGGRFREIYYWDSYFTMLGLLNAGRVDMVESMIRNFADLIHRYGHIPNGNRTYYLSRSQPPFFALMVELLADYKEDDNVLDEFLDAMLMEYRFWMDGLEGIQAGMMHRRLVRLEDETILNRYWDDYAKPRQESYREDIHLAQNCKRSAKGLWRDIRAACESGWDFSSRWLADPEDLTTMMTSEILPVDLNVLLYKMEYMIARALLHKRRDKESVRFVVRSGQRKEAIDQIFWDDDHLIYLDYHVKSHKTIYRPSLAMAYPLWAGIASEKQALAVSNFIEKHLLKSGGLQTTKVSSGQQWDAPNAWAPLQWITYKGLKNYGFDELAHDICERFCSTITSTFRTSGKLLEKYNVIDPSIKAGGGEYPVQDGFGWTNGVFLAMSAELKKW